MKKRVKVVFDRKGSVAKTGYGKIELCIYLQAGERKYETVGTATPEEWEAAAQNKNVVARIKHYEQIINAMTVLGEDLTIETFNRHVYGSELKDIETPDNKYMFMGHDQRRSFPEFIEEYLKKEGLSEGTSKHVKVVVESLNKSHMLQTFADLTPANIIKYDDYLHAQNNKTLSTIWGYHKRLKKYTRVLWRDQMIPNNPYDHVQLKRGKHKERRPLNEEELLKMRKAKLSDKLARVRDLFIFMAYTGLSYVDMCSFDFLTMTEKKGKLFYIDGARVKTGSKFFTPILPPAQAVLDKYNYQLPIITNQKLNDYLHVIQEKLDINKPITCHVARHSFATLLLTYDFPIDKVARALGHKDIKTTQVYAKILKKPMFLHTEQIVSAIR